MRIKLDENMPIALAKLLRQAGHDAVTVKVPSQRLIDSGILERLGGGLAVIDETRIRIRSGLRE